MSQNKTILLAAGGTGGHFFPALAIAEELEAIKEIKTIIITDNRCKKYLISDTKMPSYIIDLYINMSSFIGKLKAPFSILIALIKSFIFITKHKPDLIIGFGGYPSFPIMFIGQFLSVPTIIYEQNSYLGKSNKFFVPKAKLIGLAYSETKNLSEKYLHKSLLIGDLVRKNIKTLKRKLKNSKIFTILIIGGSQGAKIFSTLVPDAIKILIQNNPEIKINIIQQVPGKDQEYVKKIYDDLSINNIVSNFFHDIYKHYENANLVIARSGATTIAELTQIGLPAIFIPLPSAADNHQYYNAKSLEDLSASWVFKQEEITSDILAEKMLELIKNTNKIEQASKNLLKRKKDGTKTLLDTVLKIIA